MTNKHEFAASHDVTTGGDASDATWHPFNVWRNQVKPSRPPATTPLISAGDASAARDWDPYSVWKKQVKRS